MSHTEFIASLVANFENLTECEQQYLIEGGYLTADPTLAADRNEDR